MKVAVIGSGISGLGAAWLLQRRHDVTLFEQAPRAGGHSDTQYVQTPTGEVPVDTGFIVYSEPCYPNLTGLFRHLGVETKPSDMSFGVSIANGAFEYAGDNLATLFVQPSNLVSAAHLGMLRDILRFNILTKRALREDRLENCSLGEFLDWHGFGLAVRTRYLLPMAGAIWSSSMRACLEHPYPSLARFFDSHGLLNAIRPTRWRTVVGGSRRYVERVLADFTGQLHLGTPVEQVRRSEDGAWLRAGGQEEQRFDQVIFACHSDQALRLLADANDTERAVLGQVPYVTNRTILHSDTRLMPKRRAAWSAWNYLGREDAISDDNVTVSYWMNRLQSIPGPKQYLVTLNPVEMPQSDTVMVDSEYQHPHFTPAALVAQQRLPEMQGRRHSWFCGAWTRYGFHEDGLRSGVAVARALGVTVPWDVTPKAEIEPELPDAPEFA